MPPKLTDEQASIKLDKFNIKLIGPYIAMDKPCLLRCHCGREFISAPNWIVYGNTKSCGCIKAKLVGDAQRLDIKEVERRFEEKGLKLLDPYTQKEFIYNIQCFCGRTFKCNAGRIFQGRTSSCGCIRRRNNSDNPLWRGYEEIPKKYLSHLMYGARRRNLEFNVTPEYLWDLLLKQNRRCALSGVELKFDVYKDFKNQTASLDRIDYKNGYIEGNVQWVHKKVNWLKGRFYDSELIEWCKLIYLNNKDK